jgi:aryl-phospho-beta-D-glucosidase BglC (GH1 family)
MQQLGINFLRLPIGYWNVIDVPQNPNPMEGEAKELDRIVNLNKILPVASYKPYID